MRRPLAGLVAVLLLASCGDVVQFAHPPDRSAPKEASGHTPSPHVHTSPASGNGKDPFAEAPIEGGEGSEGASAAAGNEILYTGVVERDPSFELPSRYTLYVSAGHPPKGRPPVLSKRYGDQPSFPLAFEIRRKDLAFGDTSVDPEKGLVLYLILSESGYVMASSGVYVKTGFTEPIPPGTQGVVLTLRKP